MNDFPDFMKNSANKVDSKSQYTPGIEGYVYDGVDGSQMAFWTYKQTAKSGEHSHEYEEYIAVIQGQYTIIIGNDRIILNPGGEYVVPKGIVHSGEAIGGTRAIYAFGGKRAKRAIEKEDVLRLSSYLSFDYHDQYGYDRRQLLFLGNQVFKEYQDIALQVKDLKIEVNETDGQAQMQVLGLARKSGETQDENQLEYDTIKFKINFKKEKGNWKIIELEFLESEKIHLMPPV